MKELLDQDSDPPLKMPEVKLITKLGCEESLSELCKSPRVSVCLRCVFSFAADARPCVWKPNRIVLSTSSEFMLTLFEFGCSLIERK